MSIEIPENSKQILKDLLESEIKRLNEKVAVLNEEISFYENKYEITTDEFLRKFNSGELGDEEDYFSWYSIYDILSQVKDKIESLESIKFG